MEFQHIICDYFSSMENHPWYIHDLSVKIHVSQSTDTEKIMIT